MKYRRYHLRTASLVYVLPVISIRRSTGSLSRFVLQCQAQSTRSRGRGLKAPPATPYTDLSVRLPDSLQAPTLCSNQAGVPSSGPIARLILRQLPAERLMQKHGITVAPSGASQRPTARRLLLPDIGYLLDSGNPCRLGSGRRVCLASRLVHLPFTLEEPQCPPRMTYTSQ